MQTESKNIVICCDGTGNQFGDSNSNVVKLHTILCINRDQVAYYHPGLGTMGAPNRTSWFGKKISQLAGLAFGAGFRSNMGDAYQYLMEQYRDGDKVFLFGFSRGAYTVRALAGALHVYGLLRPGNEGHLPYLLRLYAEASRKAYGRSQRQVPTDNVAEAFKETFSRTITIHFIGLWDTVSSIGWIYDPVKLLFDGQNPIVRKGRHAVSIDEHRCFFQDYLVGASLPPSQTPTLEGQQQDILQVWFAGVHSDVGGSYHQLECAPAEDALRWMIDEAEEDGLLINHAKRQAVFGEDPAGLAPLNKIYPRPLTPLNRIHESLTWKWWPLEIFPHKYFDETGIKRWQLLPWTHRREIPDGSVLHPSVERRLKGDPKYQPKNLDRDRITPLRNSPIQLPTPKVEAQLASRGFSVYRPLAAMRHPAHRGVHVAE
jgi:hypothetical protein